MTAPLKNPSELVARLGLDAPERVLLIDVPPALSELVRDARGPGRPAVESSGETIRSIKETFDAVLVWREDRSGSRAVFDTAMKRVAPGGSLWVVTALKKVRGPTTPAVHRIELADLVKGFGKDGYANDREVRVSAWNVGYRFVKTGKRETEDGRR
jgi:hypothetical protein